MLTLQLHSLKQAQVQKKNLCKHLQPNFSSIASSSPFFLYLAFQHTHHPQFAGEKFTNTSIRGMFGDAITEMDWAVGEVVQALKNSNVDDNTFLFFTADNG